MSSATVLAKSGEAVKAGPIGLAVILLLCIACYFLFKSMSKHMRQVRENFPMDEPMVPPTARAKPGTVRPVASSGAPAIAPGPPDQRPDQPGDQPGDQPPA